MKYSETVWDLAAKNAHWRYYDENFRFLRQKTLFPWDHIHWELWLQVHHMQRSCTVVSSDSRNRPTRSPFRPAFAGDFTEGKNVMAVTLNTSAFDVDLISHPTNDTFPSNRQIPPKLYRDPQQSPQVTKPLPPALSRPLATPIKIDKCDLLQENKH